MKKTLNFLQKCGIIEGQMRKKEVRVMRGGTNDRRCTLCPRGCGVVRGSGGGYCGMPEDLVVSRMAPHMWEEPPISGQRGSGTIFLAGCNLRCVFCQNKVISHGKHGKMMTPDELEAGMLALAESGVHNINLVTPTHYTSILARVLERVKPKLHIPVVWNSGGYESPESLASLSGLVDIYLPDFKFYDPALSKQYAGVEDYAEVASVALTTMYAQVGDPVFDSQGMMQRGLMVRHLVLPGCRKDSIAILHHLDHLLPKQGFLMSLMRQYTPTYAMDTPYKNLHRKLTDFEYTSVADVVQRLGFVGYFQGKDSADPNYTPDFLE